jgi:hypothetical protein
MKSKYKQLPGISFSLYVALMIVLSLIMKNDPEWSRKISMIILIVGTLSSIVALLVLLKMFLALYLSQVDFDYKDKNLVLIIVILISLWLLQQASMVTGAFSRFDGPNINFFYLLALNGVGFSGLLLPTTLLFSRQKNKQNSDTKLNVSLLPTFALMTLVSTGNIILTIVIFVIVALILYLVGIWAKNLFS